MLFKEDTDRKRLMSLIAAICLFLTGCGFHQPTYNGNRISNENQFVLEYSVMNTTETHTFKLTEGDKIETEIVSDEGEVSVEIGQSGQEPVYQGNQISTGTFQVVIKESGNYQITVTGKKAKGSVNFTVVTPE